MSYLRCDGEVTYLDYLGGQYPSCDSGWILLDDEQLAESLMPFMDSAGVAIWDVIIPFDQLALLLTAITVAFSAASAWKTLSNLIS